MGLSTRQVITCLKYKFSSSPLLQIPNTDKALVIKYDGSGVGIGGVLMQ